MPRNSNTPKNEHYILEAMDKALIPRGAVDSAVIECFARMEGASIQNLSFSQLIALCCEAAQWALEASKEDVATLLWTYGYWDGVPADEVSEFVFEWEHDIEVLLARC